ncbi:site-specific integrase [Diaminobutyricibacter tongyongensis]|uniref:Site-specific integrase n=1 Tax=Leifsonia tongyongensis TaxID=1268043 RepID=A0A6L9XTR0_9MICO|nr:site-specific integrase [Diaminobutyricibacter tongyongensis]NEN04647.1 site-specific integrase [Diaminobutyricibacter tongyongensis]
MARPRTEIGTYGTINATEVQVGKWRARTRYRFSDGKSRQVEKYGPSKARAISALKVALTTAEKDWAGELKPTTTLRVLAQMFLDHKRDAGKADGTVETYGYAVTAHIVPKIGDLALGEAKPARLQRFINGVERDSGSGAAKNCRSALSGMMSLAVINGAIEKNPVRELERISRPKGNRRAAKAIPLGELPSFLTKVRADAHLNKWDTVELIEFMLASGWRVGEACALDVSSVDFEDGTAAVVAVNVRVNGKGVVRQEFPKTEKSERVTPLPSRTMDLLRRRHERLGEFTTLLFPTPLMRLRDPSNTQREIRDRRDHLGYPDLYTHSFRKTVATILDKAGLSATEIADYLGHENPSMTQDVYMNTLKGSTRAAEVLGQRLDGLI